MVHPDLNNQSNISILQISKGDLWIADMTNSNLGLHMILPGHSTPVFIHLPQEKSLSIMEHGYHVCKAMHSCALTQPQSLSWGGWSHVFTDTNNKYYCIGAQPGWTERGVQSGLYKLKYGFCNTDWDALLNVLKCAKHKNCQSLDNSPAHQKILW